MTTRRDILKGGAGLAAILASGKAPAYLVKSMLAARNSISMRGGGAKLPYDAEVDYLESTGTQYILLDECVDGFDGLLLPANSNNQGLVGVWNGGSRADAIKYTTIQNRGWVVTNGQNSSPVYSMNLYNSSMLNVSVIGTSVKIVSEDFSMGVAWGNYFSKKGWGLFGNFNVNTDSLDTLAGRLGACKLYYQGVNIHHFIPVRFTNELGQSEGAMYDRVSGQLFRNQGTGAFLYGADKIPIETDRYVQNGLVAMWDGKENAGVGLHDPNATVWKDLVGGGLSQFSATPSWAQNGLSIVPSDNTLTFNSPDALLALASSGFSIEIVAYMPALATTRFHYIVDSTTSSNTISIFTHNLNALFILQKLGSLANVVAYGSGMTFPDSGSCATVYDAGLSVNNSRFYMDGEYTTARTNTSALSPSSLYAIMRMGGPTGIYHSLRIYNRALTAEEIAVNYAVDKARFNLP